MTFEKLATDLSSNKISPKNAYDEICKKEKMKVINFYVHRDRISKEPLNDSQLQELSSIVNILQILYNSSVDSPISDSDYDILQEMVIDMGIPRLSGSIELNSGSKVRHTYKNLRGTLDKVYYLSLDEKRTNKSRKYLDEWIKRMESRYERITGKSIDLNKVKVLCQPKFDGCFPYRTPILLADGRIIPIGEIVENKIDVEVLTYNTSTNILEAKRVVNWYKYDNIDNPSWRKITLGKKDRTNYWLRDKRGSGATIYPTSNHQMIILDSDTMKFYNKFADEVEVGDILCTPRFITSNIQDQVIRGSILGDGTIIPNKTKERFHGTQALQIIHEINQVSYITWKKNLLGYLTAGQDVRECNISFNSKSKSDKAVYLLSHRSSIISSIYNEFTNNGYGISIEFLRKLNSLGLAIWYMDDGSLNMSNPSPRAKLHTEAFSYREHEIIKQFLDERGYFCNITNASRKNEGLKYYCITMTPEGSKNFWTDISHFIVKSMDYKLPEIYRNRFSDLEYDITPLIELDMNPVISSEKSYLSDATKNNKKQFRYDLEVEDNHNYFANGILVHNCSAIAEIDGNNKVQWITRGDTRNNLATDISNIMNPFNDIYTNGADYAVKTEVMITEENKDKINEFYKTHPYHNSRQIVTAILNSNEPDFKVDYLYPVPLRVIYPGEEVETIHPDLIEKFPTEICTLGDREAIRQFANENRYVNLNGMRFRTDGVVMTIMDQNIQKILGRENNINNFEIAYKFTEESAYTKVKNIEFYISDFGFITPVLVVNDVILKGNNINRISLSNKERFDELGLCYGDEVKILYDIIPYATIDNKCRRAINGRKIKFANECPRCHEPLDLNKVQVRCTNPNCPSRIVGNILNYCSNLKIQNIGFQTLDMLYSAGLLNDGIRSLYHLKKKSNSITNLEGFGKAKTSKIISEIESKRKLNDYDFFGSLGIDNLSIKTFKLIFSNIPLHEFMNMIKVKNFDLMNARLQVINGIGKVKSEVLVNYLKDKKKLKDLKKLLKEVTLYETYENLKATKGRIVFSGCRPWNHLVKSLKELGYEPSDSWSNKARLLVIPSSDYSSSKVTKSRDANIPIMVIPGLSNEIKEKIKEITNDRKLTSKEKEEKIEELKTLSFLLSLADYIILPENLSKR